MTRRAPGIEIRLKVVVDWCGVTRTIVVELLEWDYRRYRWRTRSVPAAVPQDEGARHADKPSARTTQWERPNHTHSVGGNSRLDGGLPVGAAQLEPAVAGRRHFETDHRGSASVRQA